MTRRRDIPHLVFATRSPDPRGGTDFVRQVVAESPGVSEEARIELTRRADIAGSVLQLEDTVDELRVFLFHPLTADTWLFARAVSLGLYRKGSHQLLIHGVLLTEEVLDWLEGNPLALAAPEVGAGAGFHFLDRHPGSEVTLPPLALDDRVADLAHRHNRRRLEGISPDQDRWLAAAYDRLAAGERLACVAAEPRHDAIETLLLHFHPNDRLELSFQTSYTHSRPVGYRLIGVHPEDLATLRRQFKGLAVVDLAAPAEPGDLGELACRLRRRSPQSLLDLVERTRLTHLSHRRLEPISPSDAALALAHALRADVLSSAGAERFELLLQRAGGGLGYKLSRLAACWRDTPARFAAAVDSTANEEDKITRPQLQRFFAERIGDSTPGQRWALAALLTRPEALATGAARAGERLQAWLQLLPPRQWTEITGTFDEEQAQQAEPILESLAMAQARADELSESLLYGKFLLIWLHGRGRPLAAPLADLEASLAGRTPTAGAADWRRLSELCRELGLEEDALRLCLVRELPRLDPQAARQRSETEVERALQRRRDLLPAFAPHLGQSVVAASLFGRLADLLHRQPTEVESLWHPLRRCLEQAKSLHSGAAEAAGRLLAEIAASPRIVEVPGLLDRLCALRSLGSEPDRFPGRALAAAAARLVPELEASAAAGDEHRLLAAVTALLSARGRHRAPQADGDMMRLAIRGRVLAGSPVVRGQRTGLSKDSALALDTAWRTFLKLALDGDALHRASPDARNWLAYLQDELTVAPPRILYESVRLQAFLALAWTLWSQETSGSRYRATLCTKLRWARRLGVPEKGFWMKLPAGLRRRELDPGDWHRQLIAQRVPPKLQHEARQLLAPIVLSVGS